MPEVQEDIAEGAIKWMLKVPRLSAELIVAGLREMLKALNDKEPIGIQKMPTLMRGKNTLTAEKITSTDSKTMDADLKMLERLARKHNVGFTPMKLSGEPGYQVFFRSSRKEQMEAVITEFTQYKFYRDFKIPGMPGQAGQQWQPGQPPFEGVILEEKSIIPTTARQTPGKEPIIIDMGLVAAARKESIHDRLERAIRDVAGRDIARKQKRMMEPPLPKMTRGRGSL